MRTAILNCDLTLVRYDAGLFAVMEQEAQRQGEHIELIASENYTSPAVMEVQGSVLTNRHAEGYPHKRYYGGYEYVDTVKQLTIDRAKQLFGADYANVQPHAGSQANAVAYLALLSAGDTILGMSLAHGGHLTYGASVSSSGKLYSVVQYGIDVSDLIDHDEVECLAVEHKPKMIVAGFSVYSQVLDFARFRIIADKVGAYLFADIVHVAGLAAAGVYPNPVSFADVVTTTTYRILHDPYGGLTLVCVNEEIEKRLNSAVFSGAQGGPLEHVIAAKAVCFKEALQPEFKTCQQQVLKNAQSMAQVFLDRGFDVVPGGTQNHLFLLSPIRQDITGKDADAALGCVFITVNKNPVSNDPCSPFVTSGLCIGTSAMTARSFKEAECRELAGWICDILENMGDESVVDGVREKVKVICVKLPVYGN